MQPPKSYSVFRWVIGGFVLLIGLVLAVVLVPWAIDLVAPARY